MKESECEGTFTIIEFILNQKNPTENVNIQDCRELHRLSEYITIFVKVLLYSDNLLKI